MPSESGKDKVIEVKKKTFKLADMKRLQIGRAHV